jgi:hypothetical protein
VNDVLAAYLRGMGGEAALQAAKSRLVTGRHSPEGTPRQAPLPCSRATGRNSMPRKTLVTAV